MTEEQWLSSTDPTPMLEFLGDKASDRRLRLFVCACCRSVLPLLPEPSCRLAVEAAEQYADRALDKPAYLGVAHAFDRIRRARFPKTATPDDGAWNAVYCAVHRRWEAEHDYYARERWRLAAAAARDAARSPGTDEPSVQAALLRDIIGSPFRPVAIDPAWLVWHGGAAVKLAQAIYVERSLPSGHLDPARLAVLADMLEEAGATDAQLLTHLRSAGPHVRGCFAVDAILGKE